MRKLFPFFLGMALALGCAGLSHAQEVEKDKTKVEDHGKVVKEKTKVKDATGKHKVKTKVKDKGDTTEVKVKGK